jgi:hypothetical protein
VCSMCTCRMRNAYRVLVEISNGSKLLEKLKCVWENNIKMNLKIGCEHVDCIYVMEHMVHCWALLNTQ